MNFAAKPIHAPPVQVARISNLNFAFQIENASAFQLDAIAHQATSDIAAAAFPTRHNSFRIGTSSSLTPAESSTS